MAVDNNTKKTKRRLTTQGLSALQSTASKLSNLSSDWEEWFPDCIALALQITGPITVQDLIHYTQLRLVDDDGERFLEVMQCAALLHCLREEDPSTVLGFV